MTTILRSSPSWLPSRIGNLGASELAIAAEVTKTGKPSAARTKLLRDKVAERLTGFKTDNPVTGPMRRGIENQDAAIAAYELRRGVLTRPEAMVLHSTIGGFAATPDAFVEDGLVEVKVPLASTFVEWVAAGAVPEQHVMQMVGQLACTGAAWVDFVAYCPEAPEAKQLFVRRFMPTPEEITEAENVARRFLGEVEAMFDAVANQEMLA